jgi:hypothetical protein
MELGSAGRQLILWAMLIALATTAGCGGEVRKSAAAEPDPGERIAPYAANPSYWQYRGAPVLLLGGSDQDNLFNHPDIGAHGLEAHLDLLKSVGGNYVRSTMSSRDEGNEWPHHRLPDGRYDLTRWKPAYWDRFERFLHLAYKRDIIVQIEIWDRFDHAREPWQNNPFNPQNNVNYGSEESRLPIAIDTHPGARENPFFRSLPEMENIALLVPYQRALVDRILEISLPYPNVLYCISNETNESPVWSAYWARHIRQRAAARGLSVHVTEMWDAWDLSDPEHDATFDHPELYSFVDISQNNHQRGQAHWDNAQQVRRRLAEWPRPINSVKIYGGPRHGGGFEEGTRKLWRNIFGGFASSRFHRPSNPEQPSGIGLNELARAHLKSARMITDEMNVFASEPRNDLLSDREDDEAYLFAEVGRTYAIYFPDGGAVTLELEAFAGQATLRWLDIVQSTWLPSQAQTTDGQLQLAPPGVGPWVALIVLNPSEVARENGYPETTHPKAM